MDQLSDRVAALVKHSGMSIPRFAMAIGFRTPQAIREMLKGNTRNVSPSALANFTRAFPNLNVEWLKNGEGEMFLGDGEMHLVKIKETQRYERTGPDPVLVPLMSIDSVGGFNSENSTDSSEEYVEAMIPFPWARKGDIAIQESGDSMSPKIPSGAILLLRQVVEWREYFGYGHVYVLLLRDGRRITKKVSRYAPDPVNYVLCESINPEYPSEELSKNFIAGVWRVINVLTNETY